MKTELQSKRVQDVLNMLTHWVLDCFYKPTVLFLENEPIERCYMSYNFLRHCGSAIKYIYDQSPEYCRQWCNDNKKCHVGHWHPPYQIWGDEPRSVCFVFPHGTGSCNWGGAETIGYHKGAHMIQCMYQEKN